MTTHPAYDGEIPKGWQGGEPVTKYWNGNYIHLYRVTRPCANCGAEISLDVTKQALDGSKKNAGLLLRNCPKCRAERKAGGPGSRGGTSRPTAGAAPAAVTTASVGKTLIDTAELETLRTANITMKEELDGLYMQLKELRALNAPAPIPPPKPVQAPKTYGLPPEPLTMAQSVKNMQAALASHDTALKPLDAEAHKRMQEYFAKNNSKMPWEGG